MILKIPIYIEIKVDGDYDPVALKSAVEAVVPELLNMTLERYGGFPHTTDDFVDKLGTKVAKLARVPKLSLNLIKKSDIIRRINDHE